MRPRSYGRYSGGALADDPAVWAPTEVDTERPNVARVYDYLLGGSANFARDRAFADDLVQYVPAREFARANRSFLRRAVEYLVRVGMRQFLDLGSGLPTVGNVHEVAQRAAPGSRVVYVDHEPLAVTHAQQLLSDNDRVAAIGADLRYPGAVLDHPDTRRLIDFTQPVAVLACAVLHFVPDEDDPYDIVAAYREELCRGSHMVISHGTADNYAQDLAKAVQQYEKTSTPGTPRSRDEVIKLFDGFTLVPPGVVFTPEWRPEGILVGDPSRSLAYGGVGTL